MKCNNRFCQKELDSSNCYFYIAADGSKVYWCDENCYYQHIGAIKDLEEKKNE